VDHGLLADLAEVRWRRPAAGTPASCTTIRVAAGCVARTPLNGALSWWSPARAPARAGALWPPRFARSHPPHTSASGAGGGAPARQRCARGWCSPGGCSRRWRGCVARRVPLAPCLCARPSPNADGASVESNQALSGVATVRSGRLWQRLGLVWWSCCHPRSGRSRSPPDSVCVHPAYRAGTRRRRWRACVSLHLGVSVRGIGGEAPHPARRVAWIRWLLAVVQLGFRRGAPPRRSAPLFPAAAPLLCRLRSSPLGVRPGRDACRPCAVFFPFPARCFRDPRHRPSMSARRR